MPLNIAVSEEGIIVTRLVGYDVLRKFTNASRYGRFMTAAAR
jgi:hypothetical protein